MLVPAPSYPLFEHLTRLEAVRAVPYRLEYHGRWEIDLDQLRAAPSDTRALLLVSPNNPTGSYVSAREVEQLVAICRDRGWAIVADEVFADYPLDAERPPTDIVARRRRADVHAWRRVEVARSAAGEAGLDGGRRAAPIADAALARSSSLPTRSCR